MRILLNGWKATINAFSFPPFVDKIVSYGDTTVNPTLPQGIIIHLDEDKYKNSFSAFLQFCHTLPSKLFDYTLAREGDNIVITGLTETTVRVAIVDLVNQIVSGASVKMVKPPTNFRVYVKANSTVENVDGLADIGSFFDNGDY
jgi:hypothetical protein